MNANALLCPLANVWLSGFAAIVLFQEDDLKKECDVMSLTPDIPLALSNLIS